MIRIEGPGAEFFQFIVINKFLQFIIIEAVNLLDFMRRSEPIKEMKGNG